MKAIAAQMGVKHIRMEGIDSSPNKFKMIDAPWRLGQIRDVTRLAASMPRVVTPSGRDRFRADATSI
jgi:hypothetical protein